MPPSGRKAKTRARRAPALDGHDASDAETPEAILTPTRGSRKRTRGADTATPAGRNTRKKVKESRAVEREDTEGTEPQEPSDNETEPSVPTEQEIIQSLRVADKHVNATEDFANDLLEGQENVPGYGKIAGRDWVYIIRKVEVNIGRPEAQERLMTDDNTGQTTPTARTVVDIDLGPDRQVSRLHAVISYDAGSMQWFVVVNGRNGLRVDNHLHKRGVKTYLRNGSVIEIANTQMAFITTAAQESDGPVWDASILKQAQKSSEDDDEGEDHNGQSHPHAAGRGQLQNTGMYQSESNGQHTQQHPSSSQQRVHPHSQRATLHGLPGTPLRAQQPFLKSSPSANYARGVMMESTESIDYSSDNAKDLKPPHSYAQLIGMAILSTTEQQMTLSNIYKWIMANYAFYRFNTGGWQNSIRHNLSLNKAFTKIARRTDEPGKGMKWMIEPTEFDNFVQQGMKGCRRPNPIPGTQSTMDSPTSPMDRVGIKRDADSTPPMSAYPPRYPTALEAYTPDRGSRRPDSGRLESSVGLGINGDHLAEFDLPQRATPRNGMTAAANAAGSPPALYVHEEGRAGPLDTPFPLRPSQRLAPPSTLRRPSDFIQFSSPAPFWKMEGLIGSTPFKAFDLSPLKTPFPALKKSDAEEQQASEAEDTSEEEEEEEKADGVGIVAEDDGTVKRSPVISSSSPPRSNSLGHTEGSPSLSRPATAVAKTLSQLAAGTEQADHDTGRHSAAATDSTTPLQEQTPPATASTSSQGPSFPSAQQPPHLPPTSNPPFANNLHVAPPAMGTIGTFPPHQTLMHPAPPPHHHQHQPGYAARPVHAASLHDDAEDQGIDLAKGFQPIGAFHQRNHLAMSMGMTPAFGR